MSDFEPSIAQFINTQRELLDLERQAEIADSQRLSELLSESELEQRGRCLLHLKFMGSSIGRGGRSELEFSPSKSTELPAHRIQVGDVVAIKPSSSTQEPSPTGVVSRVWRENIRVVPDRDLNTDPIGSIRLEKVANDVTYRRMRDALQQLIKAKPAAIQQLRDVCFALRDTSVEKPRSFESSRTHLNESQRKAVGVALNAPHIALIHGPPGTGKSTAVAEFIRQAILDGEKILACAPSNIAVDNLTEKLDGLNIVRLGHPARLLECILHNSLDSKLTHSPEARLLQDLKRDLEVESKRMRRAQHYHDRQDLRTSVQHLRRGIRELENQAMQNIIQSADVVLTTTIGAADSRLGSLQFDRVVIDEAAQALEASCWIPLARSGRIVLAGDHQQLPPTIRSQKAARGGLEITLFERLAAMLPQHCHLLNVQYRMHKTIMNWSSHAMYQGKLIADSTVAKHRLCDLAGVENNEWTEEALIFIDTAGFDAEEVTDEHQESRWNPAESQLVFAHVEKLLSAGLRGEQIAIITPYNAQVNHLRKTCADLAAGLEIDTVDGFQGREKEAVVLSLVRSNSRGEVGFLAEQRRLNVAITRARRQVTIIGDSATLSGDRFLSELVDYLQSNGRHISAYEIT